MNRMVTAWCAATLLSLGTVGGAGAQAAPSLSDLTFLSGCWAGVDGGLELREQWSAPHGGVMLGTTAWFRDGGLAEFEFAMIRETEADVTLWPYPGGQRSEHGFPLVRVGDEAVFENPEHDFPVRIVYARIGSGELAPRIEGSDGRGPGWRMSRVPCPSG